MNQEEKWTAGRSSDRGLTEIAILLTLLIFVAFGFVFYFFFQKVTDLTDQIGELTARIEKLDQRVGSEPVYTRRWSPPADEQPHDGKVVSKDSSEQVARRDSFETVPPVTPKEVNTFSVRPDGSIVDASKVPGSVNEVKTSSVPAAQVKAVDLDGKLLRSEPAFDQVGRSLKIGDIRVDIQQCAKADRNIICDLKVTSVSDRVRDIKFTNKGSFFTGYNYATYRRSSFRIGVLGDWVNYRSKAFISSSLPLNVQFQFHNSPVDLPAFKTAQFKIDENAFIFKNVMVDEGLTVDQPSSGADQPAAGSNANGDSSLTTGDIGAKLLACGDGGGFLYCDLKFENQALTRRSVRVSYEKTFLQNNNAIFRATSFAVGKNSHKQRHHFRVFLNGEEAVTLRYRFYNPPTNFQDIRTAQFNIDGEGVVFNKAKVNGAWKVNKPIRKTSASRPESRQPVQIYAFRHKKMVGDIAVDLQYCVDQTTYFYCDLKLLNIGSAGRDITISKDNSFVRTPQNATYRVTSFSVGTSGEKTHHHTETYLHNGRPVSIRFRFYDPPSGIEEYETMQFNIDGQKIVFEDVVVGD